MIKGTQAIVEDPTTLKVIVAQMGARHNYALPRMLDQHGALARLYTDTCVRGAVGSMAAAWLRSFDLPIAGKLRRRTIEGVPPTLIWSAPMVNIRSALAYSKTHYECYRLENEMFGRRMIKWGLSDANLVYGVYGSGVPFWRYAKEQGLKVAADMIITPLYHRIVAREQEAYPDWADPADPSASDFDLIDRLSREVMEVADLLLCPSRNVLDDVNIFAGQLSPPIEAVPPATVVPYGIKVTHGGKGSPVPGRILFAGGADLRKGIHYLAQAATSLAGSQKHYEFRIAGLVSERVRRHPEAHALNFLGHLSKDQLAEEFHTADIFVLPTLAEGSATVVHEALALGLPVVTTRSAGSVVTHGMEGLIVAEHDSDALAEAIEKIVEDRTMRNEMSEMAILAATDFDEGPWGKRLVAALEKLNV